MTGCVRRWSMAGERGISDSSGTLCPRRFKLAMAEDSSMLWLDYTYHEAGGETLVFHLGDPPEARKVKVGYLLDPFWYWTGYSPIDNTVYAVPAPGMGHEDTELLFTIDLDDNLEVASGIWSVPGIASVAWNEATRSMIAQIVTEDGLLFQELSGDMTWSIPDEILAEIFPSSFISAANNLPNGFSASGEWAASPSGSKLASFMAIPCCGFSIVSPLPDDIDDGLRHLGQHARR